MLVLKLAGSANGQSSTSNFYHNLGYGSEAAFSPLTLILNDAFDVLQLDGENQHLNQRPYRTGWQTLQRSVAHPFRTISRTGYGSFLRSEVFPLSTRGSGGGQWVPNYQLHFIGGGVLYAMTTEWYQAHGFKHPRVWAIGTAAVELLLNETIENGGYQGYSSDTVADLFLFDPAGILFFSSPSIQRFFAQRLNLRAWPLQPALGVDELTLENAGSYFSVQWKLPTSTHWHLFYYFGMNNMIGGTYRWTNGLAISAGAGLHARKLITVNEATNRKTADLTWTSGVFVDRKGSLLASVVYSGVHTRRWSLNLYPGVLPGGRFSPGIWLQVSQDGRVLGGLGLRWIPGVSFAGS